MERSTDTGRCRTAPIFGAPRDFHVPECGCRVGIVASLDVVFPAVAKKPIGEIQVGSAENLDVRSVRVQSLGEKFAGQTVSVAASAMRGRRITVTIQGDAGCVGRAPSEAFMKAQPCYQKARTLRIFARRRGRHSPAPFHRQLPVAAYPGAPGAQLSCSFGRLCHRRLRTGRRVGRDAGDPRERDRAKNKER